MAFGRWRKSLGFVAIIGIFWIEIVIVSKQIIEFSRVFFQTCDAAFERIKPAAE